MSELQFYKNKSEEESHLVCKFDENDDLVLYSAKNCDNVSPDYVKNCRGLVFSNSTEELVCKTFPFTPEYSGNDNELLSTLNLKNCRVFESHEGFLIRAFNFNNNWYLSTNKRLDASNDKWSGRDNFRVLFERALFTEYKTNDTFYKSLGKKLNDQNAVCLQFLTTLNKNRVYTFLVRNTKDNRIVCNAPPKPKVYFLGTFSRDGVYSDEKMTGLNFPVEKFFASAGDMLGYANNIDYRKTQGLVVFPKKGTPEYLNFGVCFKVLNPEYKELSRVRGNQPSIRFRYLQIRNDQDMVNKLVSLYPTFEKDFQEYEEILYDIANLIYVAYVTRFIQKQYAQVPVDEFRVMKTCHSWHSENREFNKVTEDKVYEVLNLQYPPSLNRMIKNYKSRMNEETNEQVVGEVNY